MFNRLNLSIPAALCVTSALIVAGCGDPQAPTTVAATSQDEAAQEAVETQSAAERSRDVTATAAEAPRERVAATELREQLAADATVRTANVDRDATLVHAGDIVVVAEPAVLNLGEMATGETKRGTVTLRNTGDRSMKVLDSRTSCGCTVANVPKGQELQPGESVDVEVSLRGSQRAENLSKTVTFIVEGQSPLTVRVEGQTVAYVVVEPAIIQIDSLPDNQITIRAEDDQPFRITAMHPRIAEDLSTESSTEHVLTLSMDRWEESGQPRRLLFYLDHPKASQISSTIRVPATHAPTVARAQNTASDARSPRPARVSPDHLILQGHTAEFLSRMDDEGFDVEATDRSGTTLLGVAAKQGNIEIVQALIDAGADIEAGDRQGRTPLMHAAQSRQTDTVRLLLQSGANVDARDTTLANTALSWAAGFGNAESVRELLDAGAQTEIVSNHTGFTPLILAAGFGEAESVRLLIETGAQLEVVDTFQGFTALMYAASTGKVDNVRAMLEGGANIEARDSKDRTVLLIAAGTSGADAETVKVLLDAGAEVSAVDREGKNALQHAQTRTDPRRDEVVAVLEPVMIAASE